MKTTFNTMPGIPGKPIAASAYKKYPQHIPNDRFCSKIPYLNGQKAAQNKVINSFINLAMVGTYLNTTISYRNLLMSNGHLPGAENARATRNNQGDIIFTWCDNSGVNTANTNDKVILITYFPAIKKMVYTLHATNRGNGCALLSNGKMKGFTAETWIGFVSHDERNISDSVYAGRVEL
jgi:hypothetical protein